MAMKKLTKKCPFCNRVYEQRVVGRFGQKLTDEDRWEYGSPLKICLNCRKIFLDTDYQELALVELRERDRERVRRSSVMIVGVAVIAAILCVAAGQEYYSFGVLLVLMALAWALGDFIKYPRRMKKLEEEREASLKRLSDPAYARALSKAGYHVPAEYLGSNGSRVTEENPSALPTTAEEREALKIAHSRANKKKK